MSDSTERIKGHDYFRDYIEVSLERDRLRAELEADRASCSLVNEVSRLTAELHAVRGKTAKVPHCWEFKAEGETPVEIDRDGRSHRSDECARLGGQCQFEETDAH